MSTGAAEGVRARARRELTARITEAARGQLAEVGAAALSVRAVTRELGMAPSAVYRYFPTRDALLTALIADAYRGLADAAEEAEQDISRADLGGRWLAVFRGVRDWALAHPLEYALIYGSPVPGYVAPEETAEPASRVALLLAGIAGEAWVRSGAAGAAPAGGSARGTRADLAAIFAGTPDRPADAAPGPEPSMLRADAEALTGYLRVARPDLDLDAAPVGPERVMAVVDAWVELIGSVSFEIFGQFRRVISDRAERLDAVARRSGERAGVPVDLERG